MMKVLMSLLVVSLVGCGSALETATTATVMTHSALEQVDGVWAPIYKVQLAKAGEAHPDDDAAYHEALSTETMVHEAIEGARDAQTLMHLAVQQWQAGDDGATWDEIAPCAVRDLAVASETIAKYEGGGPLLEGLATMLSMAAPLVGPCQEPDS